MRPWRQRVPVLICLLAMLGGIGTAAADTEVYTLKNRAASELLPVLESTLPEGSRATVDAATNSIVLVGPAACLLSARTLLERLDVARRSVTVRVESLSSRALRGAGYRVEWTQTSDSLDLGRLLWADSEGEAPPPAGRRAAGRVLSTARDDRVTSSLRILDGEVGRIETGRSVIVTDRRFFGLFGSTTRSVEVSTGLLATPRVLAYDRVQLGLTPYEGDVDPAARTRSMQAATTVVVRAGEVVVLGTQERRGSAAGQNTFARRSRKESTDDRILLVSVEIE